MTAADLMTSVISTSGAGSRQKLDRGLVESLRRAPHSRFPDVEAVKVLADLARQEHLSFVHEENKLSDTDVGLVLAAVSAVAGRLGASFTAPWRDLSSFRSHWEARGITNGGAWAARRRIVDEVFDALDSELEAVTSRSAAMAPVATDPIAGWAAIDAAVDAVRHKFNSARDADDYRDVGVRCKHAIEVMSDTLYDETKHLRVGETVPLRGHTKNRLERVIEDSLAGADNERLRGLVKKVDDVAEHVKHTRTSTRRDAGIAADAVIALASMLRRVDQPD